MGKRDLQLGGRGPDPRDLVDDAERHFRLAHGFDGGVRPGVPRSDVIDPIPQHVGHGHTSGLVQGAPPQRLF
ncbi:hypothetical protein, partial [Microvirga sp. KLBC 81]|uniref:hypothetical protein n=1 Tax=Microvirga sp. KLBC 81 TaxID=1862707 RepID=UPI001FE0A8BB